MLICTSRYYRNKDVGSFSLERTNPSAPWDYWQPFLSHMGFILCSSTKLQFCGLIFYFLFLFFFFPLAKKKKKKCMLILSERLNWTWVPLYSLERRFFFFFSLRDERDLYYLKSYHEAVQPSTHRWGTGHIKNKRTNQKNKSQLNM